MFYLEGIKNQKVLKRHPCGDQGPEELGFIMPKNSDWQPVLEEFFNANGGYLLSKQYNSILVKHLGDVGVKLLKSVSK